MEPGNKYLGPKEQEPHKLLNLSISFSPLPIIPYKNYLPMSQGSSLIDGIYNIIAIRHYLKH